MFNISDSKVESSQGKETKLSPKSRPKPRPIARTTTSAPQEKSPASTTTPEPPTTPDTGTGKFFKILININVTSTFHVVNKIKFFFFKILPARTKVFSRIRANAKSISGVWIAVLRI